MDQQKPVDSRQQTLEKVEINNEIDPTTQKVTKFTELRIKKLQVKSDDSDAYLKDLDFQFEALSEGNFQNPEILGQNFKSQKTIDNQVIPNAHQDANDYQSSSLVDQEKNNMAAIKIEEMISNLQPFDAKYISLIQQISKQDQTQLLTKIKLKKKSFRRSDTEHTKNNIEILAQWNYQIKNTPKNYQNTKNKSKAVKKSYDKVNQSLDNIFNNTKPLSNISSSKGFISNFTNSLFKQSDQKEDSDKQKPAEDKYPQIQTSYQLIKALAQEGQNAMKQQILKNKFHLYDKQIFTSIENLGHEEILNFEAFLKDQLFYPKNKELKAIVSALLFIFASFIQCFNKEPIIRYKQTWDDYEQEQDQEKFEKVKAYMLKIMNLRYSNHIAQKFMEINTKFDKRYFDILPRYETRKNDPSFIHTIDILVCLDNYHHQSIELSLKKFDECLPGQLKIFAEEKLTKFLYEKPTFKLNHDELDQLINIIRYVNSDKWMECLRKQPTQWEEIVTAAQEETYLQEKQEKLFKQQSEQLIMQLKEKLVQKDNDILKDVISLFVHPINLQSLQALVVVKAVNCIEKKYVAQFGCGYGKTVSLVIFAKYAFKFQKKKVFIVLPLQILVDQVQLLLHENEQRAEQELLTDTPGIFVITHDALQEISNEILQKSWIAVDELHTYNENQSSLEKIMAAEQVYAVSATLGGLNSEFELKKKGFELLVLKENEVITHNVDITDDVEIIDSEKQQAERIVNAIMMKIKQHQKFVVIVDQPKIKEGGKGRSTIASTLKGLATKIFKGMKNHTGQDKKVVHFAYDKDNIHVQTQVLADLQNTDVIVTTQKESQGVNLFKRCFVIMDFEPKTLTVYEQCIGRSNRTFQGTRDALILFKQQNAQQFVQTLKNQEGRTTISWK